MSACESFLLGVAPTPNVNELRLQFLKMLAGSCMDDNRLVFACAMDLPDAVAESSQSPPSLRGTEVHKQIRALGIRHG